MEIFSNFDTKLDSKAFLKKVEKYGDGNVLLIKRHPLFLYKAFFNTIFAFLIFAGLLGILYLQYFDNIEYFYLFLGLHIMGIGLWIFILFKKIISDLWKYKEFIQKKDDLDSIDFGESGSFIKYSILLSIYQFFVIIGNISSLFYLNGDDHITIGWFVAIFVLNFLFLLTMIKIIQRFIDFEMDFVLVTEDEIESFTQYGLFKREIVSLELEMVKSIVTEKDGFIKSLFNIGSLRVLSEGDSEHKGEIKFSYIHRLGELKFAIQELINKGRKKNN